MIEVYHPSKQYNFNVGSIYDTKNVLVTVRFKQNYKQSNSRSNYLFVTGEPLPNEVIKFNEEQIKVIPGQVLDNKIFSKIKKEKEKESYNINLFLDSFDWYLINNKNNSECKEMIQILENLGYNERKFDLYAGCKMCPCSPGFKLPGNNKKIKNTAIFINFKSTINEDVAS